MPPSMLHETTWEWLHGLPAPWQRLVFAVVLLTVGWPSLRLVRRIARRSLSRATLLDATLRAFFTTVIMTGSWLLLIVVVLAVAGVDLVALMGGLAIGGFIVGFALKETLGNLAAGILLLVHRPYRVGEVVEIAGNLGVVLELGMALTRLREFTGKIVTIPNGMILSSAIINHTREPRRRVDVATRIAYTDDIDAAVRSIVTALARDPSTLPDPAPAVWVMRLGDDAIDLQAMAWVATEDIGLATPRLRRVVRDALQAAGCEPPAPRQDVHLFEERLLPRPMDAPV